MEEKNRIRKENKYTQTIWRKSNPKSQDIEKLQSNMIEINPNLLVIKINVNESKFSAKEYR